jgi:hypothetical protein
LSILELNLFLGKISSFLNDYFICLEKGKLLYFIYLEKEKGYDLLRQRHAGLGRQHVGGTAAQPVTETRAN